MAITLEDLDRRVAALERSNDRFEKLEAKLDATTNTVAQLISESETRLESRMSSTERRFVNLMNERFDAVMAALDKPKGP